MSIFVFLSLVISIVCTFNDVHAMSNPRNVQQAREAQRRAQMLAQQQQVSASLQQNQVNQTRQTKIVPTVVQQSASQTMLQEPKATQQQVVQQNKSVVQQPQPLPQQPVIQNTVPQQQQISCVVQQNNQSQANRGQASFERKLYGGLNNTGNDCFLISVIQVLRQLDPFVKLLKQLQNPTAIQTHFLELVTAIELGQPQGIFDPTANGAKEFRRLTHQCGNQTLNGLDLTRQHDAREFLTGLLDVLTDAPYQAVASRQRKLKSLINVIGIRMPSIFTCADGHSWLSGCVNADACWNNACHNPESMITLQIPSLGASSTLQDCLMAYCERERLEGVFCPTCNARKVVTKKIVLGNPLPEFMIVVLKRFDYDFMTGIRKKISKPVSFPLHLDVASYMSSPAALTQFELVGTIVHTGSIDHGHYRAYTRDQNTHRWSYYNDGSAYGVSNNFIQSMAQQNAQLNSPEGYNELGSPYILVYRKIIQ